MADTCLVFGKREGGKFYPVGRNQYKEKTEKVKDGARSLIKKKGMSRIIIFRKRR